MSKQLNPNKCKQEVSCTVILPLKLVFSGTVNTWTALLAQASTEKEVFLSQAKIWAHWNNAQMFRFNKGPLEFEEERIEECPRAEQTLSYSNIYKFSEFVLLKLYRISVWMFLPILIFKITRFRNVQCCPMAQLSRWKMDGIVYVGTQVLRKL